MIRIRESRGSEGGAEGGNGLRCCMFNGSVRLPNKELAKTYPRRPSSQVEIARVPKQLKPSLHGQLI